MEGWLRRVPEPAAIMLTEGQLAEEAAHSAGNRSERAAVSAGQRRVNMTWEATQALIAVSITAAFILVSVRGLESPDLKNAFFLIVGFYFGRTNHQRIGGIGRSGGLADVEGR